MRRISRGVFPSAGRTGDPHGSVFSGSGPDRPNQPPGPLDVPERPQRRDARRNAGSRSGSPCWRRVRTSSNHARRRSRDMGRAIRHRPGASPAGPDNARSTFAASSARAPAGRTGEPFEPRRWDSRSSGPSTSPPASRGARVAPADAPDHARCEDDVLQPLPSSTAWGESRNMEGVPGAAGTGQVRPLAGGQRVGARLAALVSRRT